MNIDESLLACLPQRIQEKINEYPCINEIRIRQNCPVCFTVGNKNYISNCTATQQDIDFCITKLCKNSVHTYFENIKHGYIPFDKGYRIGVCGDAVVDNGKIINISKIKSINIRVPQSQPKIPRQLLNSLNYEQGILVYSPPNYGKTTLLKAMIAAFSKPPYNKRIAVIDCKNELYSEEYHRNLPIDFYKSYPKYEAIDMAVRTMAPEIIVCDEIGLNDDISTLVECKNSGVSLICSAHARNIDELLSRKNIEELNRLKVFGGYIGINFKDSNRVYDYKKREDLV